MGLTATATTETLKIVTERLSMRDPVVIGITPNQVNLKFFVEPLPTATTLCDTLSDELKRLRLDFPKTFFFAAPLATVVLFTNFYEQNWEKNLLNPLDIQICTNLEWLKCLQEHLQRK